MSTVMEKLKNIFLKTPNKQKIVSKPQTFYLNALWLNSPSSIFFISSSAIILLVIRLLKCAVRFNPSPSLRPLTRFAVQLSTKNGIEKELARLGGCFRCFYLMEVLMHVGLWRERLTDPSAAPHALSSLFTPDMTASISPASDL